MRSLTSLALMLAVMIAAGAADAQSLKIRQIQRDEEQALSDRLAEVNEQCAAKLTGSFDWPTFAADDYGGSNSIHGFCSAALSGIARICQDPLGQDAIRQQLDRVVCARGPHEIRLGERVLTYVIDWPAANVEDQVHEFLLDHLK